MSFIEDVRAAFPSGTLGSFIGNEWFDDASRPRFDVIDPATGSALVSVADADKDEVASALDAGGDAAASWGSTSPRERSVVLRRAYELMMTEAADLARIVSAENGKPLAEAVREIAYAADFVRWFSEEAVRLPGTYGHAPDGKANHLIWSEPVGLSLLITPWNAPAAMVTRKLAPALAAGCPVIVKPAEETPLVALAIGDIFRRAGAPPGVVNVLVTSDPRGVVAALLADQRVRKLSFTGSTEVGEALLATAGGPGAALFDGAGRPRPFIVFDDADLDAAIDGAIVAKMRNGGMSCVAANRFYVAEPLAHEFAARLGAVMSRLRVGPGGDATSEVGPMITARERDRIAGLVESWIAGGASASSGAVPTNGYFLAPTVVDGLAETDQEDKAEIFGPVAPVVPFTDPGRVAADLNRSRFGLVAYLYSCDLRRAFRTARTLEVGMVGINKGLVSDATAPFGGVKESGVGREGGRLGLLEYLETKYVSVTW